MYDDIVKDCIPLEGIEITAINPEALLMQRVARTKTDGMFSFSSPIFQYYYGVQYDGPVTYVLSFDSDSWVIKQGDGLSADVKKWDAYSWDVEIGEKSASFGPANAYRAAHTLWDRDSYVGRFVVDPVRRIRIICYEGLTALPEKPGAAGDALYRYEPEDEDNDIRVACNYGACRIFDITAHELGHIIDQYYRRYTNKRHPTKFISESWAEFVTYLLQEIEYKELGVYDKFRPMKNFVVSLSGSSKTISMREPKSFQSWRLSEDIESIQNHYTPFFVDMHDDYEQKIWYEYGTVYARENLHLIPDDKISMNIDEVMTIGLNAQDKGDAYRMMFEYASRKSDFNQQDFDDFWHVYSLIDETHDPFYEP